MSITRIRITIISYFLPDFITSITTVFRRDATEQIQRLCDIFATGREGQMYREKGVYL